MYQKNARFLPSIFLSLTLYVIIYQIYIINNLPHTGQELENQYHYYKQQLEQIEKDNNILQKQLNLAVNNIDIIESRARMQLGLVKSGEKYYQFPKEDTTDDL